MPELLPFRFVLVASALAFAENKRERGILLRHKCAELARFSRQPYPPWPPADYLDARTMTRSVCLAEAMGISAMVLDMAGDVLRQTCKPAKKTSKKSSKKASKNAFRSPDC